MAAVTDLSRFQSKCVPTRSVSRLRTFGKFVSFASLLALTFFLNSNWKSDGGTNGQHQHRLLRLDIVHGPMNENQEDEKPSELTSATGVCHPQSNLVFLKTHKCASSSIQNLLLRYGVANNKLFVLPPIDNYLGHPEHFSRSLVPEPLGFDYNILAHHSRLSHSEMRQLMPNGTLFITIVRDPEHLYESMWSYFKLENFYNLSLKDLGNASAGGGRPEVLNKMKRRYNGKIGLNQMVFDMGMDPEHFYDHDYVTNYIRKLDRIFDLVMIAEHMDESLILLKDLLCWDLSDVVVFKVNARASKTDLSPSTKQLFHKINSADNQLYKYFKRKHARQVEKYGVARMKRDIEALQEETAKWYNFCVDSARAAPSNVIRFRNKHIGNRTCWMLTAKEIQFTKFVRWRQFFMVPNSVFRPMTTTSTDRYDSTTDQL